MPPSPAPPHPIGTLPASRVIRRPELRKLVPLADTTIYEMEKRGEFPRRYPLTRRCVVWDLAEVEAWLGARKASASGAPADGPDVRTRRSRPVRGS
jgi:prophage regulatory protein